MSENAELRFVEKIGSSWVFFSGFWNLFLNSSSELNRAIFRIIPTESSLSSRHLLSFFQDILATLRNLLTRVTFSVEVQLGHGAEIDATFMDRVFLFPQTRSRRISNPRIRFLFNRLSHLPRFPACLDASQTIRNIFVLTISFRFSSSFVFGDGRHDQPRQSVPHFRRWSLW